MSDAASRVPIETLLAHRGWVHALALRIARDGWDADDLEQATWAAAVAHPPWEASSPRGWLATVMRGLAHNFHRDRSRRVARELTAPPRGPSPSTDELAARADAEQIVIRAALALDEPYRAVVLLRFFEDLPPRAIAARLGVPVETVRSRLRRALAKLREELDGRDGGIDAWCCALFGGSVLPHVANPGASARVHGATPSAANVRRLAIAAAVFAAGAATGLVVAGSPPSASPAGSDVRTDSAVGESRTEGRSVARASRLEETSPRRALAVPRSSTPSSARGHQTLRVAARSVDAGDAAGPAPIPHRDADPGSGSSRAWRLRIERRGWTPEVVTGTLVLGKRDGRRFGDLFLNEIGSRTSVPLALEESADGCIAATFDFIGGAARLIGSFDANTFRGEIAVSRAGSSGRFPTTGGVVSPTRFDGTTSETSWPVVQDPSKVGLDRGAVDRIVAEAEASDTEALLVVKDGSLVCSRSFGRAAGPIASRSVTAAVASLAIPLLIDEGKIPGLETPIARWYAEFAEDARATITLRHLLTQTSGLDASVETSKALRTEPDALAVARRLRPVAEPGQACVFNDAANQLLSGIVREAAGEPIDRYLGTRLFDRLGAKDWTWAHDRAGNALTWTGLAIDPADLARLGEMLASGGSWRGDQIVPQSWIDLLQTPAAPPAGEMGLTWRLRRDVDHEEVVQTAAGLDALEAAGFAAADKLAPLTGVVFPSLWKYVGAALERRLVTADEMERLTARFLQRGVTPFEGEPSVLGFFETGGGGQFLLVYPKWRLVVVRMRRGLGDGDASAGYVREGYQRELSFLPGLVESAVVR